MWEKVIIILNIIFSREVLTPLLTAFLGASTAFYLNYKHEKKKIKNKRILKSREFLSRLYTITDASLNFYLKQEVNKRMEGKSFEEIWKSLSPYTTGLIPKETPLKVSEISFCAKSEKHKDFLSNAFMYELDVERVNTMIEKQEELAMEIEEEIQKYIVENKIEEPISVFELDYEEILGYRKTMTYKMLCKDIIEIMPSIYVEGMEIQEQHREIMKDLYPDENIREFDFEIPPLEKRKAIFEDKKEKIEKFKKQIYDQLLEEMNEENNNE